MKKFKVTVDGRDYIVEVEELAAGSTAVTTGVVSSSAKKPTKPGLENPSGPDQVEKEKKGRVANGGFVVKAPMPGSVIDIKLKMGELAQAGDVLIILEAMKMENELTAPQAGTVTEILVKKGDTVNSGDPLIVLS